MHIGVIGGGPGGSVTAAMLARLGHQVELFEAERFPRFRIGESLLPCNDPIFSDIGLDRECISGHGFLPKLGVFFEEVGSGRSVRFPFSDALPSDPRAIFQVDRGRFDELLLTTAQRHGVHLHCPVRVQRVDINGERPIIHHDTGSSSFDFIVDASGREAHIAKQLGVIEIPEQSTRTAIFGNVLNLPLVPGALSGDIIISRHNHGWAWQIPLSTTRWSIGMVVPGSALAGNPTPQELFAAHIHQFPELAARIADQQPDPVRSTAAVCYQIKKRYGKRWALVGDAGGFLDPVLSSGILLATRSGWRLAHQLHAHGIGADLREWNATTEHDLSMYRSFIRLWYDGDFIERAFFSGERDDDLHRGIASLLAGNTTDLNNRFLAMLQRRDSYWRRITPCIN